MNIYVMQSQSFCEDTYVTPKGVWSWDWRLDSTDSHGNAGFYETGIRSNQMATYNNDYGSGSCFSIKTPY